ncbi:MAG TPA: BadF/BadG/BcrA/BcrD ATPase family protein [Gaiellaceae bacterium]|nr:BadF/BadG/BcrA/BcrD ATPase family protein [Gaiellaceae bacterium]
MIGVDGGNTKTELAAATVDGHLVARRTGPGSNSHGIGAEAVARIVAALAAEAGVETPADHGAFFLCGADVPEDVEELRVAVVAADVAREIVVANDTFALLRAGTDRPDAVAVVCGAGINSVGRRADGRVVRYPALGWETGDWGGAEMLGREALSLSARAEDGRGHKTVLVERIRAHFGAATVEAVGVDVHYRRLPQSRLGELAPLVVAAADEGDAIASQLVDRLAGEVALLARKAMRDLELERADVVLGGGMLCGEPVLVDRVRTLLPEDAVPVVLTAPPVTGAVLAALDAAGASSAAKQRVRQELHGG